MKQIVFLTRILTHYRAPFHEAVRERLAAAGVNYRLIYGEPAPDEAEKNDLAHLSWAEQVPTRYFGRQRLAWQRLPKDLDQALIVIGQENRNLNNYALHLGRIWSGRRLAFFGHGRNFQARDSDGLGERFKRFWIGKVDWWFAYTQRSAEVVAAAGFPPARITVFNNAIDVAAIRSQLATISVSEREALRRERFGGSRNIGVYIGGLYDLKRIAFLVEAADHIRAAVPDFQMIIVGGGVDLPLVKAAAAAGRSWIHALGPQFGREKALFASLGRVFLMPGLVGLGVLDSFAYGTPMVTTALPYHSPEFDYLEDGVNGVVVQDSNDAEAYAGAVARVLSDQTYRDSLRAAGHLALETYTIEAMAQRFADGAIKALSI